jgi:hypothetical protein
MGEWIIIILTYGGQQKFRYHHNDINILGRLEPYNPIIKSEFMLNGGTPKHFYIEPRPDEINLAFPYETQTPSVHRLRHKTGHFNIEIPISSPNLLGGLNEISIHIEDEKSNVSELEAKFNWDPRPVPLPITLDDLSGLNSIQEIGQVVNGVFEIDADNNVIRARKPVGSDILLLLGSPNGSQEATYQVKFSQTGGTWAFLGVSDFFYEHLEQSPDLGIKPGYSTAGLATIDQNGQAKIWLAWGDCLRDIDNTWLAKTENRINFPLEAGRLYNVRHQSIMESGINISRFRLWPDGSEEPEIWLCEENNLHVDSNLPRIPRASFGLFQYWGSPTEWSSIKVKKLNIDLSNLKLKKRNEFLINQWRKVQAVVSKIT